MKSIVYCFWPKLHQHESQREGNDLIDMRKYFRNPFTLTEVIRNRPNPSYQVKYGVVLEKSKRFLKGGCISKHKTQNYKCRIYERHLSYISTYINCKSAFQTKTIKPSTQFTCRHFVVKYEIRVNFSRFISNV